MIRRMNKKGLEDSIFTWIVAFLIIIFFMLIYAGLVFAIFTGKELGRGSKVVFKESNADLVLNSKFLSFLNSKIVVGGKEEKVIDAIRFSLDPYFEIKNKEGKSYFELREKYLAQDLTGDRGALVKTLQNPRWGFGNDIGRKLGEAEEYFNDRTKEIIKELDKLCSKYYLKVPQGFITPEGLRKERGDIRDYNLPIIHNTVYRGQSFEIEFRMLKECQ